MGARRTRKPKLRNPQQPSRLAKILQQHGHVTTRQTDAKSFVTQVASLELSTMEPSCLAVAHLFDLGCEELTPQLWTELARFLDEGIIPALTLPWAAGVQRKIGGAEAAKKSICLVALSSIATFLGNQGATDKEVLSDAQLLGILETLEQTFIILESQDQTVNLQAVNSIAQSILGLFTALTLTSVSAIRRLVLEQHTDMNQRALFQGRGLLDFLFEKSLHVEHGRLAMMTRTAGLRLIEACWRAEIVDQKATNLMSDAVRSSLAEFVEMASRHVKSMYQNASGLEEWVATIDLVGLTIQGLNLLSILGGADEALATACKRFTDELLAVSDRGRWRFMEAVVDIGCRLVPVNETAEDPEGDARFSQLVKLLGSFKEGIEQLCEICPSDEWIEPAYFFGHLGIVERMAESLIRRVSGQICDLSLDCIWDILHCLGTSMKSNVADSRTIPGMLQELTKIVSTVGLAMREESHTACECAFIALEYFNKHFGETVKEQIPILSESSTAQDMMKRSEFLKRTDCQLNPVVQQQLEGLLGISHHILVICRAKLQVKECEASEEGQVRLEVARQLVILGNLIGQCAPPFLDLNLRREALNNLLKVLRTGLDDAYGTKVWGLGYYGTAVLAEAIMGLVELLSDDEFDHLYVSLNVRELGESVVKATASQLDAIRRRHEKRLAQQKCNQRDFDRFVEANEVLHQFLQYKQ